MVDIDLSFNDTLALRGGFTGFQGSNTSRASDHARWSSSACCPGPSAGGTSITLIEMGHHGFTDTPIASGRSDSSVDALAAHRSGQGDRGAFGRRQSTRDSTNLTQSAPPRLTSAVLIDNVGGTPGVGEDPNENILVTFSRER